MKYLRKFNESEDYWMDKSDLSTIRELFLDVADDFGLNICDDMNVTDSHYYACDRVRGDRVIMIVGNIILNKAPKIDIELFKKSLENFFKMVLSYGYRIPYPESGSGYFTEITHTKDKYITLTIIITK